MYGFLQDRGIRGLFQESLPVASEARPIQSQLLEAGKADAQCVNHLPQGGFILDPVSTWTISGRRALIKVYNTAKPVRLCTGQGSERTSWQVPRLKSRDSGSDPKVGSKCRFPMSSAMRWRWLFP